VVGKLRPKLDDILAVPREIARAIAVALTQKLAPRQLPRMIEPKAYPGLLQAQYFFNQADPTAYDSTNDLLKDADCTATDFAARMLFADMCSCFWPEGTMNCCPYRSR